MNFPKFLIFITCLAFGLQTVFADEIIREKTTDIGDDWFCYGIRWVKLEANGLVTLKFTENKGAYGQGSRCPNTKI